MAKTPNPIPAKRAPKGVSKPAITAKAAAVEAESAVAPVAKRAAGKKAKAPAAPVAPPAPAKAAKAHKPKLVRDSFTMPKDEYQAIDALKVRALGLGKHVRKSELLRAGLQALAALNDRALLNAVGAVPTLKTGRPKAD